MSELNDSEFDPSQPFEVIEDGGADEFNPDQPFDVVPEKAPEVQEEETPEDQLTQSIAIASTKNPDRSAEAIRLAKKYELSPEFVESNIELWKQAEEKESINPKQMFSATPALARFMSRPENAAVAKDDVQALEKIEKGTKKQSYAQNVFDSIKSGAFKVASGLAKAPALMYQEAPGPDWLYEGSYGAVARAEAAKEAGPVPESLYKNKVTQYLDQKAQQYAPEEMSKSIISSAKEGDFETAGKAFSYQVASNIPNLILLAMSRGAGLPVMFAQSSGEKFAQNLEKGIPLDKARSNALVTGSIEAGVESLGGVGSVGFRESVKQITKGLGKETAKQVFMNGFKEIAKSAGVEGAEEFVTSISQDLVDYGSGVNEKALDGIETRAIDAFIVGAGSGTTISGSAISVETGYRLFQKSSEAVASQDAYKAIGQAAQESKLKTRSPEKLKEYIGEATAGTPIQDVFIPVEAFETYFQSKNIPPAEAAKQLGISEKFEAAKESGSDITMPMAEWAAQTLNTEHYDGLAQDIKFNPEGLTPNELKAEIERIKGDLQNENAQAQEAARKESSSTKVRKAIEAQLKATGMGSNLARTEALRTSLTIQAFAEAQGLDPFEYYQQRNLQIGSGQTTGDGMVLNQADQITPRGLKVQPTKVGNELRLNPLPGVELRGKLIESNGQSVLNFARVKTVEDKLNLTADMIASMEEGAARNGATAAVVSLNQLKFNESSPMADLFRVNGYQLEERDGEKFFVKKLEMPRVFNQAKLSNELLIKNKNKLESEGFSFHVSEDPYFDDKTNEEIEGPALGEDGSSFSVYAEDKNGNEVGVARFKIEKGKLLPDDGNGDYEAVRVFKEFRRKGIATELYRIASETVGKPIENVNALTDEGKSFRDAIRDNETFKQSEDENVRGQIRFGTNSVNIDLLKTADASTFIHETGHFFVEEMHRIVTSGVQVTEQFKKDYESLWTYLGATPGEKLTVEQHEKAAEAYETYFMEGKSPNESLRAVFAKLRAWILQAYKMLVQQRVELTDDVRQVFDRMLIGFEAKAQAESEMGFDQVFIQNANALRMSDEQYQNYLKARAQASQAAEEQITEKLMRDYKKTKTKEYQNKKDAVVAEIETRLNNLPVYRAMAGLQKFQTPYGTSLPSDISANFGSANFKLDRTFMKAMYGDDFQGVLKLPSGLVADNGLAPSEVAPLFGFESGEDLVNSLATVEDKNARIEREANDIMQQRFPDLVTSNELPQEALKAVHNEKRGQLLRFELKFLAENNLPVLKDVIRKISRRVPSEQAVKQLAVQMISELKTGEIRPAVYKRAEVKFAKEAGQLLAKGDIEGAFEAKRKELLNFELYRAAVEASDDVKKTIKDFKKKLVKSEEDLSKTRDIDMVNAARALLADYGITRSEKTADEYLKSIQKYDPDAYNGILVLLSPALEKAGDYQEVSYDQFVIMKDAVNALWDLSKSTKEIEIDGKRVNREQIRSELVQKHDEIDFVEGTKKEYQQTMDTWGKAKSFVLGARAALTRVEHWSDAMDVQKNGPHRRYIWNPVSQAVAEYRVKKGEVLRQLEAILKANEKSFTNTPIIASEFKSEKYPGGFRFQNKSELIMAVLHSGNESNLHKLLVGREWGSVNELGDLDRSKWDAFFARMIQEGIITKADMDMVQQIWDLNESLKPDAQKSHKQMYGFYFKEITADPIQTPFGEYRGGYMPAKVDVNENEDAAIRNEREEFENNNKSFMFPTTGRGFTKSRVEAYSAPLNLNMNLVASHVDSVLRFTYIEPRVKEVSRLVTDKEFRSSLARIDQLIAKDMLIPWLQRAAQQKVVLPSDDGLGRAMDAAARFFRRNVSAQIMFGNVTNTLQQYTGLVVAMGLVKPRHIRNAIADYIRSPKVAADEILQKSKWMKSTQGSNIYEISKSVNDIILNPTVFQSIQNFTAKHTYFLQTAVQNQVNTIVWMGAYNQAYESGMIESDAVQFADSAVRKTQGSVNPEDVSRFETGTATQLLFKQFVGYFNMLANLNANELVRISREMGLRKGAGRAFYLYTLSFMLPAVLSAMIVQLMSGKGLDQDDDDEYLDDALKTFFESQFLTLTATLPYGGQFLASAYNRFNDKAYDDRLSLSPVLSTLEGVAGLPKELYKNLADDANNNKKLTGDVLTFIGTFTGVPAAPLRKPINYLTDVSTGEADPTGPIDFARGLATGRTGNEGR